MKRLFITLITLICISSAMMAQDNDEFDNEYFKMLEKSGTTEAINEIPSVILDELKQSMPDAPEGMIKEISDTMSVSMMNFITKQMLPVYKKNFTISEMKEVNKFFDTPIGMKFAKMNSNMREIMPDFVKDIPTFKEKLMAIKEKWMNNKDAK